MVSEIGPKINSLVFRRIGVTGLKRVNYGGKSLWEATGHGKVGKGLLLTDAGEVFAGKDKFLPKSDFFHGDFPIAESGMPIIEKVKEPCYYHLTEYNPENLGAFLEIKPHSFADNAEYFSFQVHAIQNARHDIIGDKRRVDNAMVSIPLRAFPDRVLGILREIDPTLLTFRIGDGFRAEKALPPYGYTIGGITVFRGELLGQDGISRIANQIVISPDQNFALAQVDARPF